jgi:hypothetical protein
MVAVAPINEKPSEKGACPFCSSASIVHGGFSTTLVGGGTGPDDDPNHTHTSCTCKDCKKAFVRETCSGNVWYTKEMFALKGMPSCFEGYVYPCKCGGKVTREYTDKVSGKKTSLLCYDKDGPKFDTFFSCDKCSKKIQTKKEYWYKGWDAPPPPPRDPNKKLEFKIYESIDIVAINDYAVAKVVIPDEPRS